MSRGAFAAHSKLTYTADTMAVIGCTTWSAAWSQFRGLCAVGALLAVILITVLAAPCQLGLCDRPDELMPSQATTMPSDAPLPPSDAPAHCALHCGLLILPLLTLAVLPAVIAREPLAALALRPRLMAPPLLPPPQPC